MNITEQRFNLAIEEARAAQRMFAQERDSFRIANVAEMLACSLQRIERLLTGDPYYDYDRQCWIPTDQHTIR